MFKNSASGAEIGRMETAVRLATFYGVIALYNAVVVPFWPLFLTDRGFSATDIATFFLASYATRMVVSPALGAWADHIGNLRRSLIVLVFCSLLTNIAFFPSFDFWSMLAVTIVSAGFNNAVFPIMEAVTVRGALAHGLDYARVRVSGSISFVLGSLAMGALIAQWGSAPILPSAVAILILALAAAAWLPPEPTTQQSDQTKDARQETGDTSPLALMRALVSHPIFLLLAISGSLIQAGHGVYYAFGTLNWRAQGYSSSTIGAFWAVGVIAEILLFIYSRPIVGRLGPGRLLVLGGIAGLIRWCGLALAPGTVLIVCLQTLHAFSYGATHLAVMGFMASAIPRHAAATAQTLFAALFSGLFFGLVTVIAGPVFEVAGAGTFGLSAVCCLLGLLAAWQLLIRWDGQPIKL